MDLHKNYLNKYTNYFFIKNFSLKFKFSSWINKAACKVDTPPTKIQTGLTFTGERWMLSSKKQKSQLHR